MIDIIRWGVLGAGKIAGKFVSDLKRVPGAALQAVGARDGDRAKAFAQEHGITEFHRGYENLCKNPAVDVIYVATPHVFHKEHAILCMQHGKAVLCEKPISVNRQELESMIACARTNQVFLMEAMWTKFSPHYQEVMRWLAFGKIGKVEHIEADFGFAPPFDPQSRIFNPALAGGALLDIGIYPIMMILEVLGQPDEIQVSMKIGETQVDIDTRVVFDYGEQFANAYSTLEVTTPTTCTLHGSEGTIFMRSRFHENSTAVLQDKQGNILEETASYEGLGYHFMARSVMDDLRVGRIESTVHSWDDSLKLIGTLDAIREKGNLKYPFEK